MSEKVKNMTKMKFDDFSRLVVFMRDDEKVLAIFPFDHSIDEQNYRKVIDAFYSGQSRVPRKNEFCLMNESSFGFGWVHRDMVDNLEVANRDDYNEFLEALKGMKFINETHVLNEE